MRARNDFQFQLLAEPDFGGVVAVDCDALENVEELALKLLVPLLRNGISVPPPPAGTLCGNGFVHGAKQCDLLRVRSIDEIFTEKFVTLFVYIGLTVEE